MHLSHTIGIGLKYPLILLLPRLSYDDSVFSVFFSNFFMPKLQNRFTKNGCVTSHQIFIRFSKDHVSEDVQFLF